MRSVRLIFYVYWTSLLLGYVLQEHTIIPIAVGGILLFFNLVQTMTGLFRYRNKENFTYFLIDLVTIVTLIIRFAPSDEPVII